MPDLFSTLDPAPLVADICARKSRGSETSAAAHASSADGHARQREAVYQFILGKGAYGATSWECSVEMGIPYSAASARFSELKFGLRIHPNGKRRRGVIKSAAVCVVSQEIPK